mmetsp:Transcript_85598/g.239031  ORF Transcript_85598/g.239031 Transcript_85598/m.239031 type:complete len:497 (-) Transcript_85598:205-1695(-)
MAPRPCWGYDGGTPHPHIFHYSFSECCYRDPLDGTCFSQGFTFERCCVQPLLHLVGDSPPGAPACFNDEAAYENCCIAGRRTVGYGMYQSHERLDVSAWSAEMGEPCWGVEGSRDGLLRTFERCCSPERGMLARGAPDLALALRKAWAELSEARSLLEHRRQRLLHLTAGATGETGRTLSGTCPRDSLWVRSALEGPGYIHSMFPPFGLCVRANLDLVDAAFRVDGFFHCQGIAGLGRIVSSRRQRPLHIVEVGANIGTCTIGLGMQGNYVSAVEPNPRSAELLNASIHLNKLHNRIKLSWHAASNVVATGTMLEGCGNSAHSVTRFAHLDRMQGVMGPAGTCEEHKIQSSLLGSLLGFRRKPIDLLKIDVEGHEAAVICGASQLLRRAMPVLLIELSPRFAKTAEYLYGNQLEYCLSGFRAVTKSGLKESIHLLLLRKLSSIGYLIYRIAKVQDDVLKLDLMQYSSITEVSVYALDEDIVAMSAAAALDLGFPAE